MCFTKLTDKKDKLNQILTEFEFGNDYNDNCDYLDLDEFREVHISPNDLSIVQHMRTDRQTGQAIEILEQQ